MLGRGYAPPTRRPAGPSETWHEVDIDVQTGHGLVHVRRWPADASVDGSGGERPVLVCVHGMTDTGAIFESLVEALGHRWTVLAPDAPGHGGTPWQAGRPYDLTAVARGVAEALDQLVAEGTIPGRIVLLGHSVGAIVALQVALLRPHLVQHLVLEEPPRRPLRRRLITGRHRAHLVGLQQAGHEARLELVAHKPGWTALDRTHWSQGKDQTDPRVFDLPLVWGPSTSRMVGQVGMPVTMLLAAVLRGSTVRLGELRYRWAGGANLQVTRVDAGHLVRLDNPAVYYSMLESVLQRYSQ